MDVSTDRLDGWLVFNGTFSKKSYAKSKILLKILIADKK